MDCPCNSRPLVHLWLKWLLSAGRIGHAAPLCAAAPPACPSIYALVISTPYMVRRSGPKCGARVKWRPNWRLLIASLFPDSRLRQVVFVGPSANFLWRVLGFFYGGLIWRGRMYCFIFILPFRFRISRLSPSTVPLVFLILCT